MKIKGRTKNELGNRYGHLVVIEYAGSKNKKALWKCKCDCGNKCFVTGHDLRQGKQVTCGHCGYDLDDNLTGLKFGNLTVLGPTGKTKNHNSIWRCKCDCGNECTVTAHHLKQGKVKSCGLCNPKWVNETGNRYGKLLVIERVPNKNSIAYWRCKCDCGNECEVAGIQLRNGNVTSCGCIKSRGENIIKNFLIEKNIPFSREYRFKDCIDKKTLPFDFAIFKDKDKIILNFLIEFDGIQHFEETGWKKFSLIQNHDEIKNKYCEKNNIKLIRIRFDEKDILEKIKKELEV